MKKETVVNNKNSATAQSSIDWHDRGLVLLFGLILFFDPLFLDIKLKRPKLMLLEFGLYAILILWLFLGVVR